MGFLCEAGIENHILMRCVISVDKGMRSADSFDFMFYISLVAHWYKEILFCISYLFKSKILFKIFNATM